MEFRVIKPFCAKQLSLGSSQFHLHLNSEQRGGYNGANLYCLIYRPKEDIFTKSDQQFKDILSRFIDFLKKIRPIGVVEFYSKFFQNNYACRRLLDVNELTPDLVNSKDILILIEGDELKSIEGLMNDIGFNEVLLTEKSPVPYFINDPEFHIFRRNLFSQNANILTVYIFHDLQSILVWPNQTCAAN